MTKKNPSDALVFTNARVMTGVKEREYEAISIRDGYIEAVGSQEDVIARTADGQARVDLNGRTVIPGIIDTHSHLDRQGIRAHLPSLAGSTSIKDLQAKIRKEVKNKRPGEWIVMGPLGTPPFHIAPHLELEEQRYPNRWDLDSVAPENPVWIRSVWGLWSNEPPFYHVVNSTALSRLGVDTRTSPPASTVQIEKTERGDELTGRLIELSVWPVVEFTLLRQAPQFDFEFKQLAVRTGIELGNQRGITGIYEGHGCASELLNIYTDLAKNEDPRLRAVLPVSLPPWDQVSEAEDLLTEWKYALVNAPIVPDWVTVDGIYLNYKGFPETRQIQNSVWPSTGWAGFADQYNTPADYRSLCLTAARLGLRVNTVAGDHLTEILGIWDEVNKIYPIHHLRWVIVHGRYIDPAVHYPLLKRVGAAITTQPASYIHRSGATLADELQIPGSTLMAHKDYTRNGIPWALSTDNKPYDPFFTIWSAMTRISLETGDVIGPDQRMSFHQAVSAMTQGSAAVSRTADRTGSLEVAKFADLAILESQIDPTSQEYDPPEVSLTMVGGKVVHQSNSMGYEIPEDFQ